ncbi:class I SAM-dependent methyltransferase [Planococcus sp. ISL-109]|uniref:class I SAM-dependent methyltransferase n=1 Tax=Planococcus sp. ISL-109 TaxID=2819166 RepID=UPI001BE63292|nr:class I SAM-dependent methyltransferase [Planococcus sp. ISL-109]
MSKIQEKSAQSLTAESVELLPHVPYLLQDLWELGSSPGDISELLSAHVPMLNTAQILDLACGKGAVSVHLANRFGCRVKGVDLVPEFIEFAIQKAHDHKVQDLCEFAVADINETVKTENGYDAAILGAAGDVLGTPEETLRKLIGTVKSGGYMILDDAYAHEKAGGSLTKEQWLAVFGRTGVELIADREMDGEKWRTQCRAAGFDCKTGTAIEERVSGQSTTF